MDYLTAHIIAATLEGGAETRGTRTSLRGLLSAYALLTAHDRYVDSLRKRQHHNSLQQSQKDR